MPGIPLITPYTLPTKEALPLNVAQWSLQPERAILLVHDMQRFFVRALPEPLRSHLVRRVARLRRACQAVGVPVAYTAQPGGMSETERGLLQDFWGVGMRTEPADRELVVELTPQVGDWVFTKWRYSAFFRSDLHKRMQAHGRDQILLCGVYAHIGVLNTALEAFANDLQPFLVADALGDFSELDQRLALEYAARCCAMVITSEEVFS
jgi:trans-2,3-dihydro-3-hydroxyanthranilic acid synthase